MNENHSKKIIENMQGNHTFLSLFFYLIFFKLQNAMDVIFKDIGK